MLEIARLVRAGKQGLHDSDTSTPVPSGGYNSRPIAGMGRIPENVPKLSELMNPL